MRTIRPDRTLTELLAAAGIDAAVTGDAPISDLAYDSRSVVEGALFCCIRGANSDGHDFAAKAIQAGASSLLVDREIGLPAPTAVVKDVRDSLGSLAATFFGAPSREIPVAAVTGTNGKTTVTYFVESIARAAGHDPGVIGTISRRHGGITQPAALNMPLPIDLQRLLREMRDAGADLVVLEATSDGLEQGRLRGMQLATAAFTNLSHDHLNTHGTMEAYFEAKALLFDEQYTQRAVLNVSDEHGRVIYERVKERLDVLTFGETSSDIAAESVEVGAHGCRARLRTPAGDFDIETQLVGRYNVANAMCAFGMCMHLGIPTEHIVSGIASLQMVDGRLESIDCGQSFLVLVDYAHTPDALAQALGASRELAGSGKLIVVFGCGGDRDRAKRPLMGEAATRVADLSVITSDNPRSEEPMQIIDEIVSGAKQGGGEYVVIADRREAIAHGIAQAKTGDVVLVAGKGHEQGQTFGDKTLPFDDRDVVRTQLEELACRS